MMQKRCFLCDVSPRPKVLPRLYVGRNSTYHTLSVFDICQIVLHSSFTSNPLASNAFFNRLVCFVCISIVALLVLQSVVKASVSRNSPLFPVNIVLEITNPGLSVIL